MAKLRHNLRQLAKATDRPHALFLQEAGRGDDWTIGGYRSVVAPRRFGAEHDNCRILVREDVEHVRSEFRQVPGGDWQWKKPKPARTYVCEIVKHAGTTAALICIHRVPKGPLPHRRKNRRAWEQEHQMLVRWVGELEQEVDVVVVAGDWNTRKGKLPRHWSSLRSLAKTLGAVIRVKGIDGALVVGGRAGQAVKLRRRYGSDAHRPVWIKGIRP